LSIVNNAIINIYSIAIMIIVYHQSINHLEKCSFKNRLFMRMVIVTLLMLVADIFSRFEGNAESVYPLFSNIGSFIIFMLVPTLPSIWLLYVHYQIFLDEGKTKKLSQPLAFISIINLAVLIISQFTGLNTYNHGQAFLLPIIIMVSLLLIAFVLIIINYKDIEKRYFQSLLNFTIIPLICLAIQIKIPGISIVLSGVTLSTLVVLLNIQNRDIYMDYLTGVSNRKKLDIYLKEKISLSTEKSTFSAIMLDLNDFKHINDTYGHCMGDEALKIAANLLNSCIRSKDLIARFGGDEFFMVIDTSDISYLEGIVSRIKSTFEGFNESNRNLFNLGFGYGYTVYDYSSHMTVEEFERYVDKLMYKNKQEDKELNDICLVN